MKVSKDILKTWKLKSYHGIKTRISKDTGISRNAITRAFNGNADLNTINSISEWFNR